MNRLHIVFSFLILLALVVIIPLGVEALSKDDIVFPVVELGSCENENECRAYCDEPDNIDICLDFAATHNLLDRSEIEHARKFQAIRDEANWPGGCDSEESCEAYCNDITNIEECLAFAEEHGFIDDDELEEARRVKAALDQGAELPGGCQNKDACEVYCEEPDHIEECIAFAEAAGFLSGEELEEARRFMQIMKEGRSPGGCRGERECFEYCEDESHFEECLAFAEEAGFISAEEAEMARRTGGKGPGGCVRDECEDYCEDPANQDECLAFALEHEFLTEEEYELIKGRGGLNFSEGRFEGPGGCSNEEECKIYCSEPENREECAAAFGDFEGDHDGDRFDGGEPFEDVPEDNLHFLNELPSQVGRCVEENYGLDRLEELRTSGIAGEPVELEAVIRKCFGSFGNTAEFIPEKEPRFEEDGLEQHFEEETFHEDGGFIEGEIEPGDVFQDGSIEDLSREEEIIRQQIEEEIRQQIIEEEIRKQEEEIRRLLEQQGLESGGIEGEHSGFRGLVNRMVANILSVFGR